MFSPTRCASGVSGVLSLLFMSPPRNRSPVNTVNNTVSNVHSIFPSPRLGSRRRNSRRRLQKRTPPNPPSPLPHRLILSFSVSIYLAIRNTSRRSLIFKVPLPLHISSILKPPYHLESMKIMTSGIIIPLKLPNQAMASSPSKNLLPRNSNKFTRSL